MDQGIYTAASGAIAMEQRLTIISNNLANVNTVGFKKDGIAFDEFSRLLDTEGLYPGQYRNIPEDVVIGDSYIDASQGSYRKTGNTLDVAIMDDGFFVVNTEDGPRYTRAGAFQVSSDGMLTTQQGYTVQGEGGDIALQAGNVQIDAKGTVSQGGNDIDVLQVVDIPSEYLVRDRNGLFDVKEGFAPEAIELPVISQGSIETSNVDPIKEMVGLITTQRAYDSYQKVIRSFSDTYNLSIRDVGQVS